MIRDPRLDRLRTLLGERPTWRVIRREGGREAAVGVIMRNPADPEILLIKRAERVGDPWSGHMAFPGGNRSSSDADLAETFVRETREETGIELAPASSILGALDLVAPVSPRLPPIYITPFVAVVPPATRAVPDRREVVDAFWIPLEFLRDERNAHDFLYESDVLRRTFPAVKFGDHVIWGLTHRILSQFLEVAEHAGY